MDKIIWTKQESISGGKIGYYRGVIVEKTKYHYWVKWSEHVDWAAPHSKMSDGLRSAQSAKALVDYLLEKESQDKTMIVQRFNQLEQRLLWTKRGYKRGA
jgi:hypothetical protein